MISTCHDTKAKSVFIHWISLQDGFPNKKPDCTDPDSYPHPLSLLLPAN